MQCLTCDLTSICKIYEFISLQKAHADISVNNCRVKRTTELTPYASNLPEEVPMQDFKMRSAETIASVTERIRELSRVSESEPEPDSQKTFAECPECKQGTRPSDIVQCENCKKQLCIGCAVENNPDKKIYCEECWDNL